MASTHGHCTSGTIHRNCKDSALPTNPRTHPPQDAWGADHPWQGKLGLSPPAHDRSHFSQQGFIEADTVMLYVDDRLMAGIDWWPPVARLARERTAYRRQERWHVDFVHNSEATGTSTLHPTWAGIPFLTCGCLLYPGKNWILMDTDAAPTALYDVSELATLHPGISAPGIYVISEGAGPINAGIVTVPGGLALAAPAVPCITGPAMPTRLRPT